MYVSMPHDCVLLAWYVLYMYLFALLGIIIALLLHCVCVVPQLANAILYAMN